MFPRVIGAASRGAGHALHVPPIQGSGRIDNPDMYRALYASESREGACAERFGRFGVWSDHMLTVPDTGARMTIATLEWEGSEPLLDLDDPAVLASRGIRPSRVVTRDRAVSRAWSRDIFNEGRWAGVRWWSYYDADWGSVGIWGTAQLRVLKVEQLKRDHPALEEARRRLHRLWM